MLIILEGVDGAGKSTLASAIEKEIKKTQPDDTVEYIHASQIKGTVYEEYVEPLVDYTPSRGRHIIIDRWHVGERIYGPLYRNSSGYDNSGGSYEWIELFLGSKGARLWNVTQTLETLQERLAARGEDYLEERHVDFVREQFSVLSKQSAIFASEVSPNETTLSVIAEHIVVDAAYADFRAASLQGYGIKSYVGRTFDDPQTILVVDNKAKNIGFNPEKSEEARILLDTLRPDFIQNLAVVSSVSQSALAELLERLSMTGVLAYSETVSARLTASGINHIKIDEPSTDRMYPVSVYNAAEKAQDLA